MLLTDVDFSDVGFFEGTEKLLEIWFRDLDDRKPGRGDLRNIPRYELDNLLAFVKAEIVSYRANDCIDSYVLSESSMFISANKFIIKTCGTTKLLACIKPLFHLAKKYCGMDKVLNVFYSRRIYLRPQEQHSGHQTFQDEVKILKDIFPNGSAYVLGQTRGEEWYLFTVDNAAEPLNQPDVTLEILMSDLDERTMGQFTKACYPKSEEMTKATGIADLIPESSHDGLAFDPCGYSMNGLLGNAYHTIHITPQPECSYVSFETNLQLEDYSGLVRKVLKTFKPGRFIITLFASKFAPCGVSRTAMESLNLSGFRCVDREHSSFKNYTLSYGYFQAIR